MDETLLPPSVKSPVSTIAVKCAVFGVVPPIGQGDSHVQPSSSEALRLGTCVVLVMTRGAVPVAIDENIWPE